MKQCKALTKAGEHCKRSTSLGSDYCLHHRRINSNAILSSLIGGVLIGSLFSTVGAIVGGVLGGLLGTADQMSQHQ